MASNTMAELVSRARVVIPHGVYGHQGVGSLPAGYPQFYRQAQGCQLWGEDGQVYTDYLCGYGPNILGYKDIVVENRVEEQRKTGVDTTTGPGKVMVLLAEKLVSLNPGLSWSMFAKNGNDVTTLAVTVARAATGKKNILVQPKGYHGAGPIWTKGRPGVLETDTAYQVEYEYNNLHSVEEALEKAAEDGGVAAVIVSAFDYRYSREMTMASKEWAEGVRALCTKTGALLILDDVRAGFRLSLSSSWSGLYGVTPDLVCYSKAIANGHALSALVGSEDCRQAGAEKVFATGSFWFSSCAIAAGLATLEELENRNAVEELSTVGNMLKKGLVEQSQEVGLKIKVTGPPSMPFLSFDEDQPMSRARGELFTAECARLGVLVHPHHNWFLSLAHTEQVVQDTLAVTKQALARVHMEFGQ